MPFLGKGNRSLKTTVPLCKLQAVSGTRGPRGCAVWGKITEPGSEQKGTELKEGEKVNRKRAPMNRRSSPCTIPKKGEGRRMDYVRKSRFDT